MYATTISHLLTQSVTLIFFIALFLIVAFIAVGEAALFFERIRDKRNRASEAAEPSPSPVSHIHPRYTEEVYDQFKDPRRHAGEEVFDQEAV